MTRTATQGTFAINAAPTEAFSLIRPSWRFKNVKRHFQLFIEGVADYAIFLLDTSGRITSWSSTAQKVIGYKMDEIVGEHFGVLYRPDERRAGEPNRAIELAI